MIHRDINCTDRSFKYKNRDQLKRNRTKKLIKSEFKTQLPIPGYIDLHINTHIV